MRAERRVGLRPPMLVKSSGSVSEPGSGMPDSECMVDAGGGGDGRWGSQEGYESESLEDVGELRRSPENIEQEKEQNQCAWIQAFPFLPRMETAHIMIFWQLKISCESSW